MLAVLAPGQGSQSAGMLSPWLEAPRAQQVLTEWSDIVKLDLLRLGTSASSEEIRDTANAQPLIVATGLLVWRLITEWDREEASGKSAIASPSEILIAGHSVGEITAASLASSLSANDAIKLVGRRGVAMARAARSSETGMSAVLGGKREDVLARLSQCNLQAANENGAGQIVAAGLKEDLKRLQDEPPLGARVRPLEVAGAFHTEHMAAAEVEFEELANLVDFRDPQFTLISNQDGGIIKTGDAIRKRLISQIKSPVRWDLCMEKMRDLGVNQVIELAPSGTLAGLVKRVLSDVTILAIKGPEDLITSRELLKAGSLGGAR